MHPAPLLLLSRPFAFTANSLELAWGVSLFLISLLGSLAVVTLFLSRLPADYLRCDQRIHLVDIRPRWLSILATIGKNLLGVLLVAIGVVLSLPGVPGQGILTILIGIMLLDIPGKQKLERKILGRPAVLDAVNRMRLKRGREPLLPPPEIGNTGSIRKG